MQTRVGTSTEFVCSHTYERRSVRVACVDVFPFFLVWYVCVWEKVRRGAAQKEKEVTQLQGVYHCLMCAHVFNSSSLLLVST